MFGLALQQAALDAAADTGICARRRMGFNPACCGWQHDAPFLRFRRDTRADSPRFRFSGAAAGQKEARDP